MALRKPSEYFKKDTPSVDNSIQELVKSPELNTFSDAFQSFKNNLSKIEVLSDFSETLDNYRVNIERVNHLSSSVEDIKTEIQTLLNKEDLDRAMMSQLLVVEQSIQEVQNKVKGISEKNLTEIRLDVAGLTENVNKFLEIEVPKYKKLIVDSEIRTNTRYGELEQNVNQTLEGIGEFVDDKYQQLTETLQGINGESLAGILEDFKILENIIQEFKENDIPKYKGFIIETERKTETKLNEFDEKFSTSLDSLEENLTGNVEKKYSYTLQEFQRLENEVINLKENDIPKYKGFIIETERKTETKLNEFDEKFSTSLDSLEENLTGNVEKKYSYTLQEFQRLENEVINLKENDIPKYKGFIIETEIKTENKINIFQKTLDETVSNVLEKINLIEDDKNNLVSQIVEKIDDVKKLSNQVTEELEINESYTKELKDKIADLEINIVRNETHIKVQNKNFQAIQEEVKETLGKINLQEFEEKSYELGNKIKYLEEVFEKFNEKQILTETIIVEPPSTDNKDPLTPLDQKFITLDQLQEHYRLFLNRIQQQLSTLGGGGETRLKYLDDIVGIATNPAVYDGKVLSYNHSIGKFEFITGGGGGNAAITISDTPPLNPEPGNLWYDNTIGRTFIYYQDVDGSQWVDASPAGLFGNWTYTNTETITQTNVGIGTTTLSLPSSKMEVFGGDVRVGVNTSHGVVMTSPNGTKYRLLVNDDGTLTTTAL